MRKLVLFDVDHTIVRGNLTTLMSRRLFSLYHWRQLWVFLYRARFLAHGRFAQEVERALLNQNYPAVDVALKRYVAACYDLLLELFEATGKRLTDLIQETNRFFLKRSSLKRICYQDALERISFYAQDPLVDILFISGGLQVVLDPFILAIQQHVERNGLCKARLFAYGTRLFGDGELDLCVGTNKVDRVHEHHAHAMDDDALVIASYSDNRYYSDLPLLFLAEERFVVGKPDLFIDTLPQEMRRTLLFLPRWQ